MKTKLFIFFLALALLIGCKKEDVLMTGVDPCSQKFEIKEKNISGNLDVNLDLSDINLCMYQYQTVTFYAPVDSSRNLYYLWKPDYDSSSVKTFSSPGVYSLIIRDYYDSLYRDTVLVTLNDCRDTLLIELGSPDTAVCMDLYSAVALKAPEGYSYNWGSGNDTLQTKIISSAGTYAVSYYQLGVQKRTTVQILKCEGMQSIYVPNVITSGTNNSWAPVGANITAIYFEVRNTDGVLMFSSNTMCNKWDGTYNGKPAPTGFYMYAVEYVTTTTPRQKVNGYLELIR